MWNPEGSRTSSAVSPQAPVVDPKLSLERRTSAWIGQSVFVKGEVVSAEDLIIDGRVEGTIKLGGSCLTVGAGAVIQADLTAHTVIIGGIVTGNVTATERLEIRETGSVDGDISAPRLAVRDGAVIRGRIDTASKAPAESVTHYPVAV